MKTTTCVALLTALVLGLTLPVMANDPGYFLSWQQKKELVCLGRIQDAAGNQYDVWIVPGYVPPARYARDHFKEAGSNFHEYFEANKYRSLKEGSKACFHWALKSCGLGFTVKGIPRAWGRYFSVAHERTQRRVFGWWLAYPWAFMESSVETAFRGALGSVGTVGGVVSGLAIVPAYHALDSAVAGVWNLGVNTVILPAAGITWNTVVSPPLALVGQKPAPSRVDGFWVTMIKAPPRSLSAEEVRLLGQWGLLLLKESQPFAQRREQINKDTAEKRDQWMRAMKDSERQKIELQAEEREHIRSAIITNNLSSDALDQIFTERLVWNYEADIRRQLAAQNLPEADITNILRLLRNYGSPRSYCPVSTRKKTDPLQRGVEVIGESVKDTLK